MSEKLKPHVLDTSDLKEDEIEVKMDLSHDEVAITVDSRVDNNLVPSMLIDSDQSEMP